MPRRRGLTWWAGYIEPHTRPETMALLEGLEVLPTKTVTYKGISLKEFDLDGALARHPQLLLVDELAHTNAAGSRHTKRYQDIQELLRAGINVYTTVNVQHLESLNDVVASITGISVSERVPDNVFDSAYQVEVVDLEPADLLERLREGKIYRGPQAAQALDHFFSLKNLASLREIALRRTADQLEKLPRFQGEVKPKAGEHILICLSGRALQRQGHPHRGPDGQGLSRGVYSTVCGDVGLCLQSEQDRKRLRDHVHLAEELGARIATAYGDDPAVQIAEYARISGISKVVLGRSPRKRGFTSPKNLVIRLNELAPTWTSISSRTRRPGRASGCGGCGSPRKSSPPRTWPRCWEFCCCVPWAVPCSAIGGLPTPMSSCSIFWGFWVSPWSPQAGVTVWRPRCCRC